MGKTLEMIKYLLTGGFLKGYRSYIIGTILILQAVGAWAAGDVGFMTLMEQLPEILMGMGIMTAKAASE